MRCSE
ncbi:hypothetical protein ECPA24_0623, partial [Escherichia coli PA24]